MYRWLTSFLALFRFEAPQLPLAGENNAEEIERLLFDAIPKYIRHHNQAYRQSKEGPLAIHHAYIAFLPTVCIYI